MVHRNSTLDSFLTNNNSSRVALSTSTLTELSDHARSRTRKGCHTARPCATSILLFTH